MRKLLSFSTVLIFAAVPVLAEADDPPARVARVNYLNGSVSFRPASVDDWTAATLNYPLTTGDHLWADANGRVEIHAGSTAIRMNAKTAMSVLNLDDRTIQLSLTDGSLHIRLRHLEDDETVEIDTPNVAVTLLRTGEYRIDADGETSTTSVTVRSGNAEVTGGGLAFVVRPREAGKAVGMDNPVRHLGPALPAEEFDSWCEARDSAEDEATVSAQYVPRDMVGYEDLDRNGVWSEIPEYGPVWRPRTVAVDWAPYRYGHWAWIEPWGWTWIDDAPWGFAPFHYGRWVLLNGGWVWVPGQIGRGWARPVYAPALVVFVGNPGFRGAAWFPLGPREVYRPVYRSSDFYLRRINHGHVTNINVTNVYINQRTRGAITAADRDVFLGRRHVGREMARIDEREFGRAAVIGSAPPMAPQRVSVIGQGARVSVPERPFDRQVTVRRTPPSMPSSFESRRAALDANPGRPVAEVGGGQGRAPRVRVAAPPVSAPAVERRPVIVQPSAPERPVVVDRPATRRPPVEERPVFRPAPRVETPAPAPVERPRVERPAPRVEAPPVIERPRMERPRTEAPPRVESPRPVERPRMERPQRSERPVAEKPAEKPAEPKSESKPAEERRIPRGRGK